MKILEKIIDTVCVILMFTLFIVILLQILFRYFFNMPLKWTEELARYVFVWVSMIGWTYGTRYDTHIQVNIFSNLYYFYAPCFSFASRSAIAASE